MDYGQAALRSTDEDSDEEFPSLAEVSTLVKGAEEGETSDTFWERWQRMREQKKDKPSGLPSPILSGFD